MVGGGAESRNESCDSGQRVSRGGMAFQPDNGSHVVRGSPLGVEQMGRLAPQEVWLDGRARDSGVRDVRVVYRQLAFVAQSGRLPVPGGLRDAGKGAGAGTS